MEKHIEQALAVRGIKIRQDLKYSMMVVYPFKELTLQEIERRIKYAYEGQQLDIYVYSTNKKEFVLVNISTELTDFIANEYALPTQLKKSKNQSNINAKDLEIMPKYRDEYIEAQGLTLKEVKHTDNMTRTIFECENNKGEKVEVAFSNIKSTKKREETNTNIKLKKGIKL